MAPMPMIGPYAFVMMASGMLSISPKNSPTNQPGHGKRAAPMTNPIAKRAMKAAVIADLLSGEGHRQHDSDVHRAEHQAANHAKCDSGHAPSLNLPPIVRGKYTKYFVNCLHEGSPYVTDSARKIAMQESTT
jgi:hypothetical protein